MSAATTKSRDKTDRPPASTMRRDLACDASFEIECLARLMITTAYKHDPGSDLYQVTRGLMQRIDQLNGVIFDAVLTDKPTHDELSIRTIIGLPEDDELTEEASHG